MTNADANFPDLLRRRLEQSLPGREAQMKMASMRRFTELERYATPANPKIACVLNLLHWHGGAWRTVLIERTTNPKDRHSGQISFPGGRYEPTDGELVNVAKREAEEEIGIPAHRINILGALTELYIPVSNFLVYPFVGLLEGEPHFTPQPGEVQSILTPDLAHLKHPNTRKTTERTVLNNITLQDVPYFDVEGQVVWGATAMILSEFLELVDVEHLPNFR